MAPRGDGGLFQLLRGDVLPHEMMDEAPVRGKNFLLTTVARVAWMTVVVNAEAIRDTRLALAIFLVAATTLGWPGGGGGTRPSAAPFIDTVVFNVILLMAGLLLWGVSTSALHDDQSHLSPPAPAPVSWAERYQHGLLWVAVVLLLFSYIVVPIRAISLSHFGAPIVSRVLTYILKS